MAVDIRDVCYDKYIYLDWQVYKYMINPRCDKHRETDMAFNSAIPRLKKKYKIPFSEGHIRDRANRYNPQYRQKVEADFRVAESINDQYCLCCSDDGKVGMVKKPMLKLFDAIMKETQRQPTVDPLYFCGFQVDMNQLDTAHPLHDLLIKTNGMLTTNNLSEYLEDVFYLIFKDNTLYNNLRHAAANLNPDVLLSQQLPFDRRVQLDRLLYYMAPMLEAMQYDRATLVKKWPEIARRWFEQTGKKEPLPRALLLIQGYSLLDFYPSFNDKLKKNNTADNIRRDGIHCYYASEAEYYITEDEKTREKTQLIYEAYGIKTKVVGESELLNRFEFV